MHKTFRINDDEKELIKLLNSQTNVSDFVRDLLKKELNNQSVAQSNEDLKAELNAVNLKLDTVQQSLNMLNMFLTSNSISVQNSPVIAEKPAEKKVEDDFDMDAFDNYDNL